MKMKMLVMAAMALTTLLGYAQQSGSGSPPPSNNPPGATGTGTGTGIANSTSNVTQVTNSRAGFVQAIPGGVPGTFPGYAPEEPGCQMGTPKRKAPTTRSAIEASANAGKLPRGVKAFPISHEPETAYDGPIGFMNYNPDYVLNTGDEMLASIILPGKYHQNVDQLREIAERELEKAAPGMQRIAIVNCPEVEGVTKANTFGFGVTVSGTPESGNLAGSGAVGFTHGTSKSMRQAHPTLYAYAMNGGGLDYIPPEPQGGGNNQPPQTPAINLNVRVDLETLVPLIKELIAAKPAPAPIVPVPAVPAPCTSCTLPEFVAYFDFAKSDIKSEYLPDLDKTVAWLKSHTDCNVVIEGHTDKSGGVVYNDGLGARRSWEVYNYFIKHGVSPKQIRYDSFGKHEATLEHHQPDRKVVLHVEGASSDPNAPINPAK